MTPDAPPDAVGVAIDAPLRQLFDYEWPATLPPEARAAGVRVSVPFGRRSAVGIVVEPVAGNTGRTLKPVRAAIDTTPLLDGELLGLLRWTAEYYHHPIGEVLAAALPRALREGAPALATEICWKRTGEHEVASLARAPRQRQLWERLAGGAVTESQLHAELPGWREAARALRARGWIVSEERAAVAADAPLPAPAPAPTLSPAQAAAVAAIDAAQGRFWPVVLEGATGSGKTEVYVQCAQRALARGSSVLILVPEIALTPQLIARVAARLPVPLATLHSGLADTERLAAWRACRAGHARVVLGTRSAVFAPLPGLGLIIVDEEHDSSYKQQEGGCRYHARDVAVMRAHRAGVPVVLGSATPAFETLHNVAQGRYQVLALPRREDQAPSPALHLIDLRAHAVHQGLATPTVAAMRRHLAAGGQVLVFINRRGYAPTLLCTACGWIAPCKHCDARLTVHRSSGALRCHHCGAQAPLPERCLRCGNLVKPVGQGTERVEETLRALLPDAPLVRLDRDAAAHGGAEAIVAQVLDGTARVLVGTQMVTKGHHFPGVSLVVVLNADQGLFSTDFRAAERLAQTIIQVAGRAGREHTRGEVVLQSEYPEHPLLQSLLHEGYAGFAAAALVERAAAHWPPYARLAVLRASAVSAQSAFDFLQAARAAAPAEPGVQLLGPVSAALARRAGRHYAQLLIESPERSALHRLIEAWLPVVERLLRTHRVRVALDVDPLEIQ